MHMKISVQWARKGHMQCKSTAFLLYKCEHKCFKTAENWSVTKCLEKARLQLCMIQALPVCPLSCHRLVNATRSQFSNPLALFQSRAEREERPINISESKPRCFPLNNESGTFGPSQGETASKNCSLGESYF